MGEKGRTKRIEKKKNKRGLGERKRGRNNGEFRGFPLGVV